MARGGVFSPFANPRFALYFSGQVVANTGAWFQNLTLALVILGVTGSAQALSGVTVAQFLPLVLLSVPAGRLADRVRPRTIMLCTSALSCGVIVVLAFAASVPDPSIWLIYALIAVLGTVATFERVAAQAIIFEIVGAAGLARAVALSTIALASARSIGPGLAGLAFTGLGARLCMLVYAGSYLLVLVSVLLIRPSRLHPRTRTAPDGPPPPSPMRNRTFLTLIIVNAVVALLCLNLMLVLTSATSLDHAGDATAVGLVHGLNAVGAILGGVLAAARAQAGARSLILGCLLLGVSLGVNAAVPTLGALLAVAPLLGLGVGYYQGLLQSAAQSSVAPAQLGRAMSLVMLTSYGVAPFGALLAGRIIDAFGGRTMLGIGACAALACSVFVLLRTRRAV